MIERIIDRLWPVLRPRVEALAVEVLIAYLPSAIAALPPEALAAIRQAVAPAPAPAARGPVFMGERE